MSRCSLVKLADPALHPSRIEYAGLTYRGQVGSHAVLTKEGTPQNNNQ